ncbi:MAG: hypothetical protein HZB51_19900 [Chloroflexi bacterium]|nr:hypothetical protein [Chloroflexota bacterium]
MQRLHTYGSLSASFRPDEEIVALRAYLRHRASLLEHRAAHIQHMQKALVQMNVQLTQVLSDITGETGLAILHKIVAGTVTHWHWRSCGIRVVSIPPMRSPRR